MIDKTLFKELYLLFIEVCPIELSGDKKIVDIIKRCDVELEILNNESKTNN